MSIPLVIGNISRWLANVFLKVLVFKKRDKDIWIFGAWRGKQYNDNSKYFFEYIQTYMPEVRAIWITKDNSIKEALTDKGFECYLYNEKQALKLRLNAGYVFFTNSMTDVGGIDLCHGAKKVALWHGMPLKKLNYATNNLQKRNRSIIRLIQYLILKIYNHTQRSITIATSKKTKEFLIESFEVKPQSVFITGQPRNDILFSNDIKTSVFNRLNHNNNERFILYMPTWRDSDKTEKPFLNSILKNLFEDVEFMKSLKSKNVKLYIKPHPNISTHYASQDNIIILDHQLKYDPQKLMAVADVLITDYSSVFIDYALTERPIHFFVPDLKEYAEDRLGLFIKFQELADFWINDVEKLKEVLLNDDEYDTKGLLNTSKVNKIYDDPILERGRYNEKLLEVLKNNFL